MQLTSTDDIDRISSNPSEMDTIYFKCQLTIKDPTIEINEKIKIIKRIYSSLSESQGESTPLNCSFGNLYVELSQQPMTDDQLKKCLKKANQLFNKTITGQENEVASAQVRLQRMRLSSSGSGMGSQETAQQNRPKKLIPLIELTNLRAGTVANKFRNSQSLTNDEFKEYANNLKKPISHFQRSITGEGLEHHEESIFINEFIKFSTKAILLIKEAIKRMREQKINSSTIERAVNISRNALLRIKEIELKSGIIDSYQDTVDFYLKIEQIQRDLEILIKNNSTKKPLPEEGFPFQELITVLNGTERIHSKFMKLIEDKASKRCSDELSLSIVCNAWANFFKFTEKNYFSIRGENKSLLFTILIEAEKVFEQLVEVPSLPFLPAAIATYITILVQKHPFIDSSSEKQKNLRKLKVYCYNYSQKTGKNVENQKLLNEILKINMREKIEANLLSPKNSPVNSNKKKAEAKIRKIIQKHLKEGTNIEKLLEPKKKSDERKEISILMQSIKKTFTEIKKADLKNHTLTDLDILKISFTVEKSFFFNSFDGQKSKNKAIKDQNLVIISKNDLLSRPLLLSVDKNFFAILSKLDGDLKKRVITPEGEKTVYIEGGIKKISAVALFVFEKGTFISQEMILAVPKKNQIIDKKSIAYLLKFQGKRGLMGCHSYMEYYKMDGSGQQKLKQLIIQERATGDLHDFLQTHPINSSWKPFFSILEDVIHGIDYMHSCGDIHWDIKIQNILFSKSGNTYQGRLNDFDTIFNVRSGEQPPWMTPLYGSPNYKAPEINHSNILFQEINEKEAIGRDMFALGCLLIDILNYSNNVEEFPIYEQIAMKRIGRQEIDKHITSIKKSALQSPKKFLELIAYHLIHPSPKDRWNISKLKSKITHFNQLN